MKVYAKGKNIPTYSFANLFVQGELNADAIVFILDRFYEGNDLLECSFMMRGTAHEGEAAFQSLIPDAEGDDKIRLEWRVGNVFTAYSGKLELELTATKYVTGMLQVVLKYIMQPVSVKEAVTGSNVPVPDASEQVLAEISQAVSEGLEDIQAKIDSFDLTEVEERLDGMDEKCTEFLSRPAVIPLTQAEYDALTEKTDSLYVITGG